MAFLERIRGNDRTWLWKFAFRSSAIVVSVVAIGLVAAAYHHLAHANNGWGFAFTRLAALFIPLCFSLVWNAASIIFVAVRGNWIHPIADLSCDLIIGILLATFSGISLGKTIEKYSQWYWSIYYDSNDYSVSANSTTFIYTRPPSRPCYQFKDCAEQAAAENAWHKASNQAIAGCAFAFALMFIHFALFLSACRRTHQRRLEHLRNRPSKDQEAQAVARAMIAQMTENGQLAPIQRPLLAEDTAQPATLTGDPSRNLQAYPTGLSSGQPAPPPAIHVSSNSQR